MFVITFFNTLNLKPSSILRAISGRKINLIPNTGSEVKNSSKNNWKNNNQRISSTTE